MKNKLTNEQIVDQFMDDLEHFFIPGHGGWPVKLQTQHKELVKLVGGLKIDNKKKVLYKVSDKALSGDLRAEIWKRKYEEMHDLYDKLYDRVKAIAEEF